MDGIRPNNPLTQGLLSSLSGPSVGSQPAAERAVAPPPPPPAPATQRAEEQVQPPAKPDDLAQRLASFRQAQTLPSIAHSQELRQTVQDVGNMLSSTDNVPFRFDRGAVANLLSNPSAGPVRAMPSPPSPPARSAETSQAPPKPTGAREQVAGLLSILGGKGGF
jgi:hypothetical protein